ncbi:MAG TPA: hypothetical protein VIS96_09160 [Terrimicrobiaceae bacterium]
MIVDNERPVGISNFEISEMTAVSGCYSLGCSHGDIADLEVEAGSSVRDSLSVSSTVPLRWCLVCKHHNLVAVTPDHGENGIIISDVIASDTRLARQRRHRRASAQLPARQKVNPGLHRAVAVGLGTRMVRRQFLRRDLRELAG